VAFGRGTLKGNSRRNAALVPRRPILMKTQEEKVYMGIGQAYAEYSRPGALRPPRKGR